MYTHIYIHIHLYINLDIYIYTYVYIYITCKLGSTSFCLDSDHHGWNHHPFLMKSHELLAPNSLLEKSRFLLASQHFSGWWFQPLWKIWKSAGTIKKCSKPPTSQCCCLRQTQLVRVKSLCFALFNRVCYSGNQSLHLLKASHHVWLVKPQRLFWKTRISVGEPCIFTGEHGWTLNL